MKKRLLETPPIATTNAPEAPEVRIALIGGRASGKTSLLGSLMTPQIINGGIQAVFYDDKSQCELRPIWERLWNGTGTEASAAVEYPEIKFRIEHYRITDRADRGGDDKWNVAIRDYAGFFMEEAVSATTSTDYNAVHHDLYQNVCSMLQHSDAICFLFPVDANREDHSPEIVRYYRHLDTIVEMIRKNGIGLERPVVVAMTKWDLVADSNSSLENFLETTPNLRERINAIRLAFPNTETLPVSAYGKHDPKNPTRPLPYSLCPLNVLPMLETLCRQTTEQRAILLQRSIDSLLKKPRSEIIKTYQQALPLASIGEQSKIASEIERLETELRAARRHRWFVVSRVMFEVIIMALLGAYWWSNERRGDISNFLKETQSVSIQPEKKMEIAEYMNSLLFRAPRGLEIQSFIDLEKLWKATQQSLEKIESQEAFEAELQKLESVITSLLLAQDNEEGWFKKVQEARARFPMSKFIAHAKVKELFDKLNSEEQKRKDKLRNDEARSLAKWNDTGFDEKINSEERLTVARARLATLQECIKKRENFGLNSADLGDDVKKTMELIARLENYAEFERRFADFETELNKPREGISYRARIDKFKGEFASDKYRYPGRTSRFEKLEGYLKEEQKQIDKLRNDEARSLAKWNDTEFDEKINSEGRLTVARTRLATLQECIKKRENFGLNSADLGDDVKKTMELIARLENYAEFERRFADFETELNKPREGISYTARINEFKNEFASDKYRYPGRTSRFEKLANYINKERQRQLHEEIIKLQNKAEAAYKKDAIGLEALNAYKILRERLQKESGEEQRHKSIQDEATKRYSEIVDARDETYYEKMRKAVLALDSEDYIDDAVSACDEYLNLANDDYKKRSNTVMEWKNYLGLLKNKYNVQVRLDAIDIGKNADLNYWLGWSYMFIQLDQGSHTVGKFDGKPLDPVNIKIAGLLDFENSKKFENYFALKGNVDLVKNKREWTISCNLKFDDVIEVRLVNYNVDLWSNAIGNIFSGNEKLYRLSAAASKGVITHSFTLSLKDKGEIIVRLTFKGLPLRPDLP